jgi:hypothetical protein
MMSHSGEPKVVPIPGVGSRADEQAIYANQLRGKLIDAVNGINRSGGVGIIDSLGPPTPPPSPPGFLFYRDTTPGDGRLKVISSAGNVTELAPP